MTDELLVKIERLEAQVAALTDERLPKVDRASKRRDRRRRYLPTLNVLALIAVLLFTAGPPVYAAGKKLITGADVQDNSLTGVDVANDSLTGSDVNESTLTLTCPSGMSLATDTCYGPLAGTGQWATAVTACRDQGLRLPTVAEAMLVSDHDTTEPDHTLLWTSIFFFDGTANRADVANWLGGLENPDVATAQHQYRCVTTVGARP